MIDISTNRPVYSNARGDKKRQVTPEQRQARLDKAKNIYSKAKESGLLSSLENLALGALPGGSRQGGGLDDFIPPPPPPPPAKKISTTTWILIGAGVLVVGVGIYFIAKKK
jgi:hypothetical protein